MRNQKGAAIAMVLLLLGVISVVGAALILQNKLDIRFSSALKNVDRMLGMADGAASKSFYRLPDMENKSIGSGRDPIEIADSNVKTPVTNVKVAGRGTYSYRAIYMGQAEGSQCPGDEVSAGDGGYSGGSIANPNARQYWLAEGVGKTKGTRDSETVVQVGCLRCR
ncbi:hypothetical protein ACFL2Q_00280 [Thermodesulfobacteriota bacterium]